MIRFFKENTGFSVIFLIALVIRLLPIGQYQFSYDELSALSRTGYASWHDLVMYGAQIDAHPILIQCFLFLLVKVFGYSEFWIKLPFIVMSLGTIVYAYLFSLKWFGKLQALLSAAIFSFSFIFLYYSPLARPYASGLFFTTALIYYWFNVFFDEIKTKSNFIYMALFMILCAVNSHISALFAVTLGFSGLFFLRKTIILPYLIACSAALILYLPHLPITFFQLTYGGIGTAQNGWLPPPEKFAFLKFIKVAFGTGYAWMAFGILAIESIISYKLKAFNKKIILLLVLFFVNYFVIYFYSVLKAPIFQYSVMLFAAPCLIWAVSGLIRFNERFGSGIIVLVSVLLLFQSFYRKDVMESAVLNQNEFQYNVLKKAIQDHGSEKVEAVFFDTEKYFMMQYEVRDKKKLPYHLGTEPLISDVVWFRSFLKNSKAEYLILGNAFPSQIQLAREFFPHIDNFCEAANVSCVTLSKKRSSRQDESYFKVLDHSDYFKAGPYKYSLDPNNIVEKNGAFSCKIDSFNEYPFGVEALIKNVCSKAGQIVMARIKLSSDHALSNVSFNCCVKNAKDSIIYFGGPSLDVFYEAGKPYYGYSEMFVGADFKKWANEDCKIVFFIWNRSQKNFKIEDIQIETLDYRPKRWNLWE